MTCERKNRPLRLVAAEMTRGPDLQKNAGLVSSLACLSAHLLYHRFQLTSSNEVRNTIHSIAESGVDSKHFQVAVGIRHGLQGGEPLRAKQLFRLNDRLGNILHFCTFVAGTLAQPLIGIALAQSQALHQDTFGAFNQFARL